MITDFYVENVDKVVNLIGGAVSWLSNMNKSGNNAPPDDFAETLPKFSHSLLSMLSLSTSVSKLICLPSPILIALVQHLITFSSLLRIIFVAYAPPMNGLA